MSAPTPLENGLQKLSLLSTYDFAKKAFLADCGPW
jgi:hypothetical protein